MLNAIKVRLLEYLNVENGRSKKILKNIVLSFGVKGGSIVIGLLLVPLTINYISPVQYGIWLTISSLVSWMSFFDIGMGNGLRNALAKSFALNELDEAKKYISTTYAFLSIVSIVLFILFYIISPYLDWRGFLNIPNSVADDINLIMLIVFGSFCIQFVVQLLNTVLTANHEPAIAGVVSFVGQLGVLIGVFLMKQFISGRLENLVLVLTLVPVVILFIASVIFYRDKLRIISPSFNKVDFKYAKPILNTGGAFFLIQIGAMVLFQTDNIIITKVIGPVDVARFNVVYKLFSVITMVFVVIMTPYWSAFTDAFAKGDFKWMKESRNRLVKIWLGISLIVVPFIVLISKFLFNLWIGNSIEIPFNLSILMGLYVVCYTCLSLNCFFLNGVGKLRIQLILYIFVCFVNVPLGFYLGGRFGLAGIIISNIIIFVLMDIILWIQTDKVINQKANGIWDR